MLDDCRSTEIVRPVRVCRSVEFRKVRRMPLVKVKENESIDKAIKRFKKKCEKEGIIQDIKKSSRYLKPSEKKRKKQLKAEKRRRTGRN